VRRTIDLLVKPLTLAPGEPVDPQLALLCGTGDNRDWDLGRQLLVGAVIQPRTAPDPATMLSPDAVRWASEVQRPTALLRAVHWTLQADNGETTSRLHAALKFDILDPGDASAAATEASPVAGLLQWLAAPPGWEVQTDPTSIATHTGSLAPAALAATVDLDRPPPPAAGSTVTVLFSSGVTAQTATSTWTLPIADSVRRVLPIDIDGSLADWYPADALQLDRPLVMMLSRPGLHSAAPPLALTASSIYSAWSDDNFYLAFRLAGVHGPASATHNFVTYQQGRAWGEDLAEVLLQPLLEDGSTGTALHIVAKPAGLWVERWNARTGQWESTDGPAIRYAASVDAAAGVWRGELAIPWPAIVSADQRRPRLLRFNFSQHKQTGGESASWAGPVDSGREAAVTGLLHLVEGDRAPVVRGP
jgi:hypothetical protein